MSVLCRAVCAGCSECRSPDRKSSAPSCQIVKWSVNNKSPPELCPCSAVAGDTVHSSLGMQHFFPGEDTQKLRGLSPSLPRKQENGTLQVWGCGSFLLQTWAPSPQNKSVWQHSQLLGMRKRQFQGRGASEVIAGEDCLTILVHICWDIILELSYHFLISAGVTLIFLPPSFFIVSRKKKTLPFFEP